MSSPATTPPVAPEERQRHSNARLGVWLAVFALAVFAVTLWKFRPL